MCGLCGVLVPGQVGDGELGAVRGMMRALSHRGPDAEGLWHQGPVALGHRRLSIIDLRPEGNQPLFNEDRTLAVVVNGEIYNFAGLRAGLEKRGHAFRSRSDSEVILHLYEEHGPDLVERLRGMFAFALWDARARRLLLARDRAGEKPLVYGSGAGSFWFASELNALRRGFPGPLELDLESVDQYLTLQYVPAPLTIHRQLRKLPAGHRLLVEPGGAPRVERWFRLRFSPARAVSFAGAVAETRSLVEDAVASRTLADVPVGAFLSGGIDSSTVVALMARRSTRPVLTFSVDFPSGDGGEAPFARQVARRYHTDHHELVVKPDMVDVLPRVVSLYGEPFADPSAVPTWYVSQLARRHVVVALSGDGGDETFAGYHRYGLEEAARRLAALPAPLPRLFHGLLARLPGPSLRPLREMAAHGLLSPAQRYLYFLAHFTRRDKEGLVGPALEEQARRDAVAGDFARILAESDAGSPLDRLLDLDTQTYLPDDIFTKVDIASMSHALEVRAPLVDHLLVERMATLPGSLKMRRLRGKQLLRAAVRDLLPPEILGRRKRGFSLPLGRWMREELHGLSRDLLTDGTARTRGLIRQGAAERLLGEHRRGVDHGERLWNLTVLELWLRQQESGAASRHEPPGAVAAAGPVGP